MANRLDLIIGRPVDPRESVPAYKLRRHQIARLQSGLKGLFWLLVLNLGATLALGLTVLFLWRRA